MDATEQEQQWAEEHQIPDLGLSQVGLTNDEVDELERAAWIAATGDAAMLQEAAQVVLRIGGGDNDRTRAAGGAFFRALDCDTRGDWSTWPRGSGHQAPTPGPEPPQDLYCPRCGGELHELTEDVLAGLSCHTCGRRWTFDGYWVGVATNE